VQADLGFIEYVVALQHRESWQNIGAILTSKAELASFCLELSKQLGMRYVQSPLPVHLEIDGSKAIQDVLARESSDYDSARNLSLAGGAPTSERTTARASVQQVARMFQKSESSIKK
jgi:hypothetical protein